jgi:hypothetical protein
MLLLGILGLIVVAGLVLTAARARSDDDDHDDDSQGPGGRRRVPVRITTRDRTPR